MLKRQKPSLKKIFLMTFIPLSIGPLIAAMTWSFFAYKSGMRTELIRRGKLEIGQFRQVLFTERIKLKRRARIHAKSSSLVLSALSRKTKRLQKELESLRKLTKVDFNAFYSKKGKLWVARGGLNVPVAPEKLKALKARQDVPVALELTKKGALVLHAVEPVYSPEGKHLGTYQVGLRLTDKWLKSFQDRLSDTMVVLDLRGQILATTFTDQRLARLGLSFSSPPDTENAVEEKGVMLQFQNLKDTQEKVVGFVGVAESLEGVTEVLRESYFWIFLASFLAIVVIVGIALFSTQRILKPLKTLSEASEDLKTGAVIRDMPQADSAEISDLVEAFSEMAKGVTSSKEMLEIKLLELQEANQGIKNAQTQLVQSAKMVGLGQLVAGVAHELNNPIGFIHANMYHLKEYNVKLFKYLNSLEKHVDLKEVKELKDELEIEYIRKDMFDLIKSCRDGAQRTKDIVQGLKTFSRLDEALIKEVDVREGIQSTLKILRSELKNIKVTTQFDESLPLLSCYASQVNQVWLNLIVNASHAMQPAGGEIVIKATANQNQLTVSVSDSGKGIAPQNLDKIFEPFYTTKDVGQGTGLGLSICYSVVEKHGGTITVKSKINEGTTFVVTLPLKPPATQTG